MEQLLTVRTRLLEESPEETLGEHLHSGQRLCRDRNPDVATQPATPLVVSIVLGEHRGHRGTRGGDQPPDVGQTPGGGGVPVVLRENLYL